MTNNLKSKSAIGSLALCAAFALIGCQGTFTVDFGFLGGEASDEKTISVDANDLTKLRVLADLGSVNVSVDEQETEAQITYTIEVVASRDSVAEELLDEVAVSIATPTLEPATLQIESSIPDEGIISISYDIVLPAGLRLDITTDTGSVTITDNDGNIEIDTETGSIDITNNVGNIDATTNTGHVHIFDSIANTITAVTNTGSIGVDVTLSDTGSIDLETDTGSIEIRVQEDLGATIDFDTNFGTVDANLVDFVVTNLQSSLNAVSATLNGGGATINALADFGSIEFQGQ